MTANPSVGPEMAGAPTPGISEAFEMAIERGATIDVGHLGIGGRRTYRPASGGWFRGGAISAFVAGGGEMLFERQSGPAVVEASYYIMTSSGASARLFGNGYEGRAADFDGLRLSLLIEADEQGPLAHLSQTAFVAEQASGSAVLTIFRIV